VGEADEDIGAEEVCGWEKRGMGMGMGEEGSDEMPYLWFDIGYESIIRVYARVRFGGGGSMVVVRLRVGFYVGIGFGVGFWSFGVVFGAGTRPSTRTWSVCIGIAAAASKGSELQ
jgi:hypothetical protein